MAIIDLIDSLRGMIVSQRSQDDLSFRRNVESIIKALTVQNRPAEAKALKETLRKAELTKRKGEGPLALKSSGPPPTSLIPIFPQSGSDLITIVSQELPQHLVFPPATQKALDSVLREHRGKHLLAEAGLAPRNRFLFWGPPGCGKTAAARWLAHSLDVPCGIIRLGTLITSYVGETGANLQKVLASAERSPMVLLLDEADAIAKSRDDENDVGELRRVVNALLQGLDSFSNSRSILVLASNHTHLFDPAVWRRFDDIVSFPLPAEKERITLLKQLTSGLAVRGSLVAAAKSLDGRSFADIEKAVLDVTRATVLAKRRTVLAEEIVEACEIWNRKAAAATNWTRKAAKKK